MQIRFVAQPADQVGSIVDDLLKSQPLPSVAIIVTAWATRQALLRFRDAIAAMRDAGANVRIVVGIDLQGTSKEALAELGSWRVDVRIVKHRHAGHTFHPKIILVERPGAAAVLTGSSNFTEGGLFNNYEGSALVTYALPADAAAYGTARVQLANLIDPTGATAQALTPALLDQLLRRGDIPSEADIRESHRQASKNASAAGAGTPSPFGVDARFQQPPPLPANILTELVAAATARPPRRAPARGARRPRPIAPARAVRPVGEISPTSFYMTLPTLRSAPGVTTKIPGEPRIPLAARKLAPDFWGWPAEYTAVTTKANRRYHNWKPNWRLWNADAPAVVHVEPVRMYYYADSADFRFYSPKLLDLGADEGDVVRITRIAETDVEFECVLARTGIPTHGDWLTYCTQTAQGGRRFGYG